MIKKKNVFRYWFVACVAMTISQLNASAKDASISHISCEQKAFEEKTTVGKWSVNSCTQPDSKDASTFTQEFVVSHSDEQGNKKRVEFADDHVEDVTGIYYRVISSDLFLVDLRTEQGGRGYFVSSHSSQEPMSPVRFTYRSDGEKAMAVKQTIDGVQITTKYDTLIFQYDGTGTLQLEKILLSKKYESSQTCNATRRVGADVWNWSLSIRRSGDDVVNIAYDGSYSNGKEGGAFFCTVDIDRNATNVRFVRRGVVTSVAQDTGEQIENLVIQANQLGYIATFNNFDQSRYCGAGARIPRKMTLIDRNCTVLQ
jgi:hypothetical protein